jgi:flavin-binding protein dodecin
MTRIITGLFRKRGDAERAVEHLVQKLGVDRNKLEAHAAGGAAPRRPLSPEERETYGEALSRGDIVLSAEADEPRLERVLAAFKEFGAVTTRTRSGVLRTGRETEMAMIASVSKITAASSESFDAAIREGLERANQTLRGITGLHVLEQKASVSNGSIAEYRVTMEVTFILEN